MSENKGLVYVGKVVLVEKIAGADRIEGVTVVCGEGGKWRGVVRKGDYSIGDKCVVYLPDTVVPKVDEFRFMESRGWRVKMCRFKGAPSEVLIVGIPMSLRGAAVGSDVTSFMNVDRYVKPVPANLQGRAKGIFPSFVPKTDELNYQRHFDLVEKLHGRPYYVTEKADGASTTAYKRGGVFGVCSRNWDLEKAEGNGYWELAMRYDLEDNLPEGVALQWETVGPKIQSNPMGYNRVEGLAFSAYNIDEQRYFEKSEFDTLCSYLEFPQVPVVEEGLSFNRDLVEKMGEGKYRSGREREGVVVRSVENVGMAPISFKVINLSYET